MPFDLLQPDVKGFLAPGYFCIAVFRMSDIYFIDAPATAQPRYVVLRGFQSVVYASIRVFQWTRYLKKALKDFLQTLIKCPLRLFEFICQILGLLQPHANLWTFAPFVKVKRAQIESTDNEQKTLTYRSQRSRSVSTEILLAKYLKTESGDFCQMRHDPPFGLRGVLVKLWRSRVPGRLHIIRLV